MPCMQGGLGRSRAVLYLLEKRIKHCEGMITEETGSSRIAEKSCSQQIHVG